MNPNDHKTTHFGYQSIPVEEKVEKVGAVFRSVAKKYDIMNDLMSLGMHRLWKRHTIDQSGVRAGHVVLDLAGGTGDLAALFAKRVGSEGKIVLSDINPDMLEEGRRRLIDKGIITNVEYVLANAESIPFPDNYFDCITIAFGLRNVTDKDRALKEMFRVVKPGGRALILEFSAVKEGLLKKAYDAYSFHVIPKMGKLVTNDEASYQYLIESIRMHPDQETLKKMMLAAGFQKVSYENLTAGVVALHIGDKLV
jgi:demethylmenaquinone methyltransferase/2-methoxy-6-polyprenyl-1,4-benzoquinol methylase